MHLENKNNSLVEIELADAAAKRQDTSYEVEHQHLQHRAKLLLKRS